MRMAATCCVGDDTAVRWSSDVLMNLCPGASKQARSPVRIADDRFADWRARAWYRVVMDASKIWSAEELEKMSPNERQSIVRAGFETDLSRVSPELLERTRRKIEAHISANQGAATPER